MTPFGDFDRASSKYANVVAFNTNQRAYFVVFSFKRNVFVCFIGANVPSSFFVFRLVS